MLDKLQAIDQRLEAIVSQMEDPATYADPDLLRRLTREQKELEPVRCRRPGKRRSGCGRS